MQLTETNIDIQSILNIGIGTLGVMVIRVTVKSIHADPSIKDLRYTATSGVT